jgi:hypothetical protein
MNCARVDVIMQPFDCINLKPISTAFGELQPDGMPSPHGENFTLNASLVLAVTPFKVVFAYTVWPAPHVK